MRLNKFLASAGVGSRRKCDDHIVEGKISINGEVVRTLGTKIDEILDTITFTIRERVRIKGEIQALTAQGRATAWVISALPIVLVLLLFILNKDYIMQFFNPETRNCGVPIMALAAIMITSGFIITQKIVDIDI